MNLTPQSIPPHMRRERRLRVLNVVQNLNYGGQEKIIADIVRGLDQDRFELHVLALEYLGHNAEGLDAVAEVHLGVKQSRFAMLRPVALARQLREIAPDIVHTHGGVWCKVATAARMAGVKKVLQTEHGRKFPIGVEYLLTDAIALPKTDAVVAVSEELRRQLSKTNRRFAPIMSVIENGVDTDTHSPRDDSGLIRKELGLAPDVPIIGSVGRLEWVKGYDIAIEAFRVLREAWDGLGPAPVLVVAGGGAELPGLKVRVRDYGLDDAVHLLSWRDDIEHIHNCSTIFTMTSRSEGTSVALLEAMSTGLCPVVTEVGGNAAILRERLSHRLVPSEDVKGIAEAWRAALEDDDRRRIDAKVARQQVIEHYSMKAMLDAYGRLYEAS